MGRLSSFEGKIVGIDSPPLIYFIEDNPLHAPKLAELFALAERGVLALLTSTVTISEVLVHPLRSGRSELVRAYRDLLLGSAGMRLPRQGQGCLTRRTRGGFARPGRP